MSRLTGRSLALALAVLAGAACTTASRPARAVPSPSLSPTGTVVPSQRHVVTSTAPCRGAAPVAVQHVIWIWMENESSSRVLGSPQAPYQTALAKQCGVATKDRAITHPSLPNYLAAVSGSTNGVTDDADPAAHPLRGDSLYGQLTARHRSWRGYAESMPHTCTLTSGGRYTARHNPVTYFTAIRSACNRFDVPMGNGTGTFATALRTGALPDFAFVTPDLCDDAHSCPIRTGDRWLATWVPRILASPAYRNGSTVLVVTYDEGIGADQTVPFTVVTPSVPAGLRDAGPASHYALLRTTEDLLGLPPLGAARTAPSLVRRFHLGAR